MTEIVKLDSMYKLSEQYETALSMVDEDWVLTDEALELLNSSKLDIVKKSESIFWVIRNLEARIENMKNEKEYINWKQNILKKNVEKLKDLVRMWLDTIWVEVDKNWKKSQKIKTDKWSCYYTFKKEVIYNDEEIEDKYKVKKQSLKLKFTLEEIKEKYPELIEIEEIETFDYELLKFDYDRAEAEWEKPKGIKVWEIKTLNIRN